MICGGDIAISTSLRIARNPHAADAVDALQLVVSVADNGSGIPVEHQARVFDPFFTTKDVGRGSGLGLSQVFGFAVQSGGFAELQSTPNAGTTVSLHFPCPGGTA
jgi:signal transduction histidine kinase